MEGSNEDSGADESLDRFSNSFVNAAIDFVNVYGESTELSGNDSTLQHRGVALNPITNVNVNPNNIVTHASMEAVIERRENDASSSISPGPTQESAGGVCSLGVPKILPPLSGDVMEMCNDVDLYRLNNTHLAVEGTNRFAEVSPMR